MKDYEPVSGKTYTLFGETDSTDQYYAAIRQLTDDLLQECKLDETQLLNYIKVFSEKKQLLRKVAGKKKEISLLSGILSAASGVLDPYIPDIENQLKSYPAYKILTDRRLLASREQYYLYIIEIELNNRLHRRQFLELNYKIAFLPHCLKETRTDCKAEPDEIDFVCTGCSKKCYLNRMSQLLREYDINPYIWSQGSLKKLLRMLTYQHGKIGVLGVACIVELVWGMRLCIKGKIPVIGLALNANRCRRWMGDFYDNSVDLTALERLVSGNKS